MHKPDSVQENETQRIHCDFKIQTNTLVQAKRPNLVLIKKYVI